MWIVAIIGAGLITSMVHLALQGFPDDHVVVLKTLLLGQFAVSHGIIAVLGFIINVLTPERTAAQLGWPSGPFQVKYGFAQLGLGVIGVMAIWFQGNFWAATLVTLYIYGLSGLWTHTQEIWRTHRRTGKIAWVEFGNIVLDIVYHVVLTVMSLQIPGVWSLS
jgi:hypothetical protein